MADNDNVATAPATAAKTPLRDGEEVVEAEEEESSPYASAALSARELEWAVNSPELLSEHRRINGSAVRTRCVSSLRSIARSLGFVHGLFFCLFGGSFNPEAHPISLARVCLTPLLPSWPHFLSGRCAK
jgi:hypothetical protein